MGIVSSGGEAHTYNICVFLNGSGYYLLGALIHHIYNLEAGISQACHYAFHTAVMYFHPVLNQ
jgi:hypothetical protein